MPHVIWAFWNFNCPKISLARRHRPIFSQALTTALAPMMSTGSVASRLRAETQRWAFSRELNTALPQGAENHGLFWGKTS